MDSGSPCFHGGEDKPKNYNAELIRIRIGFPHQPGGYAAVAQEAGKQGD